MNDPASLGRMAQHFEALHPPRRRLRIRHAVYAVALVAGLILGAHIVSKAMPQTALDAVMATP